jgi:hypothetical protein
MNKPVLTTHPTMLPELKAMVSEQFFVKSKWFIVVVAYADEVELSVCYGRWCAQHHIFP